MRRSLVINSLRCSIPLSLSAVCSCVAITLSCCAAIRAFNASGCGISDPETSRRTCAEYRTNLGDVISFAAKKLCKSISDVTPMDAVPDMFWLPVTCAHPNTGLASTRRAAPAPPGHSFRQRLVDETPLSPLRLRCGLGAVKAWLLNKSVTCLELSISAPSEHDGWCPSRNVDLLSRTAVRQDAYSTSAGAVQLAVAHSCNDRIA